MRKWLAVLFLILFAPAVCFGESSASFNGTTSIIDTGSGSSLDNLTAFTFCAWINPASEGENSLGRLYEKRTSAGGQAHVFLIQGSASNVNRLELSRNANTGIVSRVTSDNFISLNVWQFVCVTWDGGSTGATSIKIYKNLQEETSYSASTNGSGGFPDDASGNFYLGNRPDAARTFSGKMAFEQMFNRVILPYEMSNAMFLPGSSVYGLAALWPLWGDSKDISGNGNNGTDTAITYSSDGPPVSMGSGGGL